MADETLIRRDLTAGDPVMDWNGKTAYADGDEVEYVAYGIHAQVWPGQRADVAYVPVIVSERPGGGKLDAFLELLVAAVAPREVVFVNVINGYLATHLEARGFRCLSPEDAFEDDGSEAAIARSTSRADAERVA